MASVLKEYREFFRQFRQSFHSTGSLIPSGRWLARALARPLRNRRGPCRILEVGPGTGAVTRHLASVLETDDRLDLVELNEAFIVHLERRLSDDGDFLAARDRIHLYHTSIETFTSCARYDYIISGLPFNNFSGELVERILCKFSELLVPGGTVSFFEYMYLRRIKSLIAFGSERRRLRTLDAVITRRLTHAKATRDWVFLNAPPAWAHHVRLNVESIAAPNLTGPPHPNPD